MGSPPCTPSLSKLPYESRECVRNVARRGYTIRGQLIDWVWDHIVHNHQLLVGQPVRDAPASQLITVPAAAIPMAAAASGSSFSRSFVGGERNMLTYPNVWVQSTHLQAQGDVSNQVASCSSMLVLAGY